MNKTITLTKTDTIENMVSLAYIKGYSATITKTEDKTVTSDEAIEKGFNPKEFLENGDVIIEIKTEANNPQSPEEYVAEVYQKLVDQDILDTFMKAKRSELREKQKAEEVALQEGIENSMGKTEAKVS